MVQQVTSTQESSLQLMLRLLVHSVVLWHGLISIERLRFVLMLILLLTLRRLESLVQKVSDFAVQSICSSKRTELLHLER